jgi:hypothetical protein
MFAVRRKGRKVAEFDPPSGYDRDVRPLFLRNDREPGSARGRNEIVSSSAILKFLEFCIPDPKKFKNEFESFGWGCAQLARM